MGQRCGHLVSLPTQAGGSRAPSAGEAGPRFADEKTWLPGCFQKRHQHLRASPPLSMEEDSEIGVMDPCAPGSTLCETECVCRCRGSTHVQYAHIKRELDLSENTGTRCSLWFFNPLNLSTGAHCFRCSRTDFTEGQDKPNKPCGLNILLMEQTLC